MMTTTTPKRDRANGRYAHSHETACTCGHTLGDHAAERCDGEQPCFEDGCDCQAFKRARR